MPFLPPRSSSVLHVVWRLTSVRIRRIQGCRCVCMNMDRCHCSYIRDAFGHGLFEPSCPRRAGENKPFSGGLVPLRSNIVSFHFISLNFSFAIRGSAKLRFSHIIMFVHIASVSPVSFS